MTYLEQKKIIFHNPIRQIDEFARFAEVAAQLKEHGDVLVDVGTLADRNWPMRPQHLSPWHDYADRSPSLHHFFPHPQVAEHLDTAWLQANQDLIKRKADILEQHGLKASIWAVEPFLLPESFFTAYPHLRGPRVDHPRRSSHDEFSLCTDHPETLDIYRQTCAQLKQHVPQLMALSLKGNDAGSAFCWAASGYPGRNGPRHCEHVRPGQRVGNFLSALHEGFKQSGDDPVIYYGGNMSHNEIYDVEHYMPENTHLHGMHSGCIKAGAKISSLYPIKGIYNPLEIIKTTAQFNQTSTHTLFMDFRSSYDRGGESTETVQHVVELVNTSLKNDAPNGTRAIHNALADWCSEQVGADQSEALFELLLQMDECFRLKNHSAPGFTTLYAAVSNRLMTRPFVFNPNLLNDDEESYFLPHVFNIFEEHARNDYIDIHGARLHGGTIVANDSNSSPAILGLFNKMASLGKNMQRIAPEHEALSTLGLSLRMWSSLMRSIYNFYQGQLIRYTHQQRIEEVDNNELIDPSNSNRNPVSQDLLHWNALMRDEIDNTAELIQLLKDGGLDHMVHAAEDRYQCTFVLGPDLIQNLESKIKITKDHWLDVEKYLVCPNV